MDKDEIMKIQKQLSVFDEINARISHRKEKSKGDMENSLGQLTGYTFVMANWILNQTLTENEYRAICEGNETASAQQNNITLEDIIGKHKDLAREVVRGMQLLNLLDSKFKILSNNLIDSQATRIHSAVEQIALKLELAQEHFEGDARDCFDETQSARMELPLQIMNSLVRCAQDALDSIAELVDSYTESLEADLVEANEVLDVVNGNPTDFQQNACQMSELAMIGIKVVAQASLAMETAMDLFVNLEYCGVDDLALLPKKEAHLLTSFAICILNKQLMLNFLKKK